MTDGLSPLTACDLALLNMRDHDAKGRELYAAFRAAQVALIESGTCQHPADRRTSYRWEHDNGYGRQSWHTGHMCQLCEAKDPYMSGSWYSRAALEQE